MTTFAASQHSGEPGGVAGDPVIRRPSRRDKVEALGLLPSMLGILLGLALTVSDIRLPAMTGPARTGSRVTSFAPSLTRDARTGLGAIGLATLSRVAMIALALLLILVILPAVLNAAGIQAVAAI